MLGCLHFMSGIQLLLIGRGHCGIGEKGAALELCFGNRKHGTDSGTEEIISLRPAVSGYPLVGVV